MMKASRIQRLACIFAFCFLILEPSINVLGLVERVQPDLSPAYKNFSGSGFSIIENIWDWHTLRSSRHGNVITIILSGKYSQGWLGIGFSKEGNMVGSSAMVGWAGQDGKAMIKQYSLEGYSPSEVKPDKGNLALTNVSPVSTVTEDGSLYMAFQLKIPEDKMVQKVIFASSIQKPDSKGLLSPHTKMSALEIDFSTGREVKYGSLYKKSRKTAGHGVVGVLAWQVAIPLGILFPVYFKHLDPQWFFLHLTLQCTGYAFAIISMVLGLKLATDLHMHVTSHKYIGVTCVVLSSLQVLALVIRPRDGTRSRRLWSLYHIGVGYLAAFLGFLNVYLGIRMAGAKTGWIVLYFALLVFYSVLFLALTGREEAATADPPVIKLTMRYDDD